MTSKVRFAATGRQLHVDQLLTNMAIGYTPRQGIGDMLFPMVEVQKQSDFYTVFEKNDMLRIETDLRSPNKEANLIEQSVSSGTYFCQNRALKYAVTIEDRANADPVFLQTLINGRAQYILDKLALSWEKRVADQVTNPANVGASANVSVGWGNLATADVIGDMWSALYSGADSTGYNFNSVAMGEAAWRNFRRNAALKDLVHGNNNGGGYTTMDQVRDLFGLERFNVGQSFYNSANETQTPVLERVWGDEVLFYYAPIGGASMIEPSFGYSFRWAGNGLANMNVERHPFSTVKKSEEIEVGYYQDEKITGKEFSYLLRNVNSSQP